MARHRRTNTIYGYRTRGFPLAAAGDAVFTDIAAYGITRLNVSIDGSTEPTAEGQMVIGAVLFPARDRPIIGRLISAEDDRVRTDIRSWS